jgi:23S rRNA (uracil1939-C5)-methyltransferase
LVGNEVVPETIGRNIDVSIEKMVYGGEGLARTAEGVLLVPLVLPGERASVQLEERRQGVRRGRLLQVLEPSADRIPAECPYFARCGGCHYQHIRYERQLQVKQDILKECFERVGKIRLEVPIAVLPSEPWQYRNRTRFQIHKESSRFEIGYFELLSHRLCPIEHCPVSSPAINDVLGKFCQGAGAACFPEGDAELELFASDTGQAMMATVYSSEAAPPVFGEALQSTIPQITSVCWRRQRSNRETAKIHTWGNGSIAYHVGEFHYRVGHESFFQTNRFVLDDFIRAAVGDLEGKRALDLYAGVGLFTIPLARRFEKVAAVESHPASARDLESNVGVVGARARAYRLTAEKFLATASPGWEVIVADPPRSGLNRLVLEHLCRLRPRLFVYISCDPATQARDLATLIRAGYGIRSVHLVDLFPQTFHVESVVHMERLV